MPSDGPSRVASDDALSEYVQTIDQRLADIRQLEENLEELRQFYFTLLWAELGGMSLQSKKEALRKAEATQGSLDVIIEDLEEREEVLASAD